jgi:hypothetical protein
LLSTPDYPGWGALLQTLPITRSFSSWKNAPKGAIRKTDITIAKNYLTEEELSALNRIVTMYLDYAEDQAENRRPMRMVDWIKKLDDFLKFNERNILTHAGKVSSKLAETHANQEFEKYETKRRQIEASQPTSDFDQVVEKTKALGQKTPGRLSKTSPTKKNRRTKKPRA